MIFFFNLRYRKRIRTEGAPRRKAPGGRVPLHLRRFFCRTKSLSNAKKNSLFLLQYLVIKNYFIVKISGIEKEYEQKVLPDGKLLVDGFLCIFDVSAVPNRSLERMVELTAQILGNLIKTKRPVVLVTTKCDEANEVRLKNIEKKNYRLKRVQKKIRFFSTFFSFTRFSF